MRTETPQQPHPVAMPYHLRRWRERAEKTRAMLAAQRVRLAWAFEKGGGS